MSEEEARELDAPLPPGGSLRPQAASLAFPGISEPDGQQLLHEQLAQRWAVLPEELERVIQFTDRLKRAAEDGQALLVVAVHRENFPTLGYLVHGLRELGVRAFGVYVIPRFEPSKPEPFEDCMSCRGSFGVLAEIVLRAPVVPLYLQAHAQRAFLSQLLVGLRPDMRVFQEIYDWMDAFVDPAHEAVFEAEQVFSRAEIAIMRASERYARTRLSGFIYKDGGAPMAQLLRESSAPSVQLMPCPPRSFQREPLPPPVGPIRLAHAGQLRSAGASRAFGDLYAVPLYRDLLAQGLDLTVFPSAVRADGFEAMFGDYQRLADQDPQMHCREHLSLEELIGALHGEFHYGILLYHFNADLIVGQRHLRGALASKLFVYWAAGLPVLVSEELDYMASLVHETGAGLVVSRAELGTLGARLAGLDYPALQAKVRQAQTTYHIERFLPAVTALLTSAGAEPGKYAQAAE